MCRLNALSKKIPAYIADSNKAGMLVYGILQKFSFANSSSGRIADGVATTAEETRFAFAIASCKLSPFFRQAMTEPMCESPAPMVSA